MKIETYVVKAQTIIIMKNICLFSLFCGRIMQTQVEKT